MWEYLGRYLLTDQNRLRSVNDIMPMIGARFYTQLDAAQMRNDVIEEDLAKVNNSVIPTGSPIVSVPTAVPQEGLFSAVFCFALFFCSFVYQPK